MWQFSNLTVQMFKTLGNAQQNHRMMLLQNQMALDNILARQARVCGALNLTGGACCTLLPDLRDN